MPYGLIAAALIAVSILKHLGLQYAGIREKATPVGANIFIGLWMVATAAVLMLAPWFRDAVLQDLHDADPLPLLAAALKGILVMAIVTGKQRLLGGRRTNAYALVAFLGIGPLGLVNGFFGEALTFWQYVSVASLSAFGVLFLFIDDMRGATWADRAAFLLVIAVGATPAMTDHFAKSRGLSWETSWVVSNVTLLLFAAAVSLKTEGMAAMRRAFVMAVRDRALLAAAAAWVLSEAVILWVSFTRLDVTVSETTRNLYIPILMVLSAALFPGAESRRQRLVRAAVLGGVAYALALPMMLHS